MAFAGKKLLDRASRLGLDIVGMDDFEAKEAVKYELMRRRHNAIRALENTGLKPGAICLYNGRKVEVVRFFNKNPHRGSGGLSEAPQMVTRDVETGRGVNPFSTSVRLLDKNGGVLPINFQEVWSSHFPKFEE